MAGGRVKCWIQLATSKIAVVASNRILVPVAQEGGDIALAVGKIRSHEHVKIALAPVLNVAGRRRHPKLSCQVLHKGVVVIVLKLCQLSVNLKTFEVFLHDEVDEACDCVGAVCRGCAA